MNRCECGCGALVARRFVRGHAMRTFPPDHPFLLSRVFDRAAFLRAVDADPARIRGEDFASLVEGVPLKPLARAYVDRFGGNLESVCRRLLRSRKQLAVDVGFADQVAVLLGKRLDEVLAS